MANFHIVHLIPNRQMHIFNGYNEVIETVIWGLHALGHHVTYDVNSQRVGSVQIVFGAQMMSQSLLSLLPDSTIIYNLEQLSGLLACGREMDEFQYMAERFTIWDYSLDNMRIWRDLGVAPRLRHVPIGYAPCIARIPKPPQQDIDVLIYGAASDSRFSVIAELCQLGLRTMFFYGIYHDARDDLVGRSKVVANITSWPHSNIFPIVRASYLLANRKAVVADYASVEADLVPAVHFAPLAAIPRLCKFYVENEAEREELADRGFSVIARRDVRAILQAALVGEVQPA